MKNIAIIGRPNVGKSTLFNTLIGQNLSITSDYSGVTRDRIKAICSWRDTKWNIIDTGGITNEKEEFATLIKEQSSIAIRNANIILFLVDSKIGVTNEDDLVANILRKSRKNVIVVVNKCDKVGNNESELFPFYKFGFKNIIGISALKKLGIGDLLDGIYDNLKSITDTEEEERIKVAIIRKT